MIEWCGSNFFWSVADRKGEIWGRGLVKKSQVCKKELSGGVEAARITQSKQDLLTYAWGDPLLPRSLSLSLSFSFFSHLPRFDISAFKRNNYLHIFIHNKSWYCRFNERIDDVLYLVSLRNCPESPCPFQHNCRYQVSDLAHQYRCI